MSSSTPASSDQKSPVPLAAIANKLGECLQELKDYDAHEKKADPQVSQAIDRVDAVVSSLEGLHFEAPSVPDLGHNSGDHGSELDAVDESKLTEEQKKLKSDFATAMPLVTDLYSAWSSARVKYIANVNEIEEITHRIMALWLEADVSLINFDWDWREGSLECIDQGIAVRTTALKKAEQLQEHLTALKDGTLANDLAADIADPVASIDTTAFESNLAKQRDEINRLAEIRSEVVALRAECVLLRKEQHRMLVEVLHPIERMCRGLTTAWVLNIPT